MRQIKWIVLLCLLLCCTSAAQAQPAPNITRQCRTRGNGVYASDRELATDGRLRTYMQMKPGASITLDSGALTMHGLFLRFYDEPLALSVEAQTEGEWTLIAMAGLTYLTEWVDLPEGVTQIRLTNAADRMLLLDEAEVYGEGERPAGIHTWRSIEKADLLLMVAHPDDELLWFAGLLPTYGGDRKLNVLVAYAAPANGWRKLELLDGLWTCGIDIYPEFLGFKDIREMELKAMLNKWGVDKLYHSVTDLIRTYRPEVMVTQAFSGEYGHGAHRAMADAASKCVFYAADPAYATENTLPVWQIKKLYIHLYDQNRITMDWKQPLAAFGGETSLSVATRALACHRSQTNGSSGWSMEKGTKKNTDYTQFGLYYTSVGPDEAGGDFMEHIPAAQ